MQTPRTIAGLFNGCGVIFGRQKIRATQLSRTCLKLSSSSSSWWILQFTSSSISASSLFWHFLWSSADRLELLIIISSAASKSPLSNVQTTRPHHHLTWSAAGLASATWGASTATRLLTPVPGVTMIAIITQKNNYCFFYQNAIFLLR